MTDMIICDVLTGFLGSGKTTLLNAFLHEKGGNNTAVIVNEFGEIGLDQFLLKQIAENVYLLDSGCLCCTVTHSLVETLLQIKNLAAQLGHSGLNRVVIETTGLADPLPILHALLGDQMLMKHFRLGWIIATVDAVQGIWQLREHSEPVRQVSVAEQLVITKADLADETQLLALHKTLGEINPHAQVTESKSGDTAAQVFDAGAAIQSMQFFTSNAGYVRAAPTAQASLAVSPKWNAEGHNSAVGSWSAFVEGKPTWVGVSAWWNLLMHEYGGRLLRCKGLLDLNDARPFVMIQGVGKVFHPPQYLAEWPDSDRRSRLVCIGLGLDKNWLQKSLQALLITEPFSRPLTLGDLNHCF